MANKTLWVMKGLSAIEMLADKMGRFKFDVRVSEDVRGIEVRNVVTVYDWGIINPRVVADRHNLFLAKFISVEPVLSKDVQYVIVGPHVWGRGPTTERALLEAEKAGCKNCREWVAYTFPKEYECYVNEMGEVCWSGPGGRTYPVELFKHVHVKEKKAAKA